MKNILKILNSCIIKHEFHEREEVATIKTLFRFSDDDFEVWKSEEHKLAYYNISIEGYMGFDEIESIVSLYQEFTNKFYTYLIENNHKKTEKHIWKCVYQTRAVEVCHDHGCYWVFLDGYKSSQIWDLYYYMEDVIAQLKTVVETINLKESKKMSEEAWRSTMELKKRQEERD